MGAPTHTHDKLVNTVEQYKTRLKTGNVRRVTDEDALCIDTQKALPRQRMQAKSSCVVGAKEKLGG